MVPWVVGVPVEPALLPVRLLQTGVQLLQVQVGLGAQVQHPPVEVLQLHREGHSDGRVAVQTGEVAEHLFGGLHLSRAVQVEEAEGDVELGGGVPVGGGARHEGDQLLS